MHEAGIEVGSIVFSKAGRDKGNYFMVYEVLNQDFVTLVDGSMRKLANPKKKKVKHVKNTLTVLDAIAAKLRGKAAVYDAEIYSALKKFNM